VSGHAYNSAVESTNGLLGTTLQSKSFSLEKEIRAETWC
jgi:hypothetical protein